MAKSFRSLKALSLRLPSLPEIRSRMCANVSFRRFLRAAWVSGAGFGCIDLLCTYLRSPENAVPSSTVHEYDCC